MSLRVSFESNFVVDIRSAHFTVMVCYHLFLRNAIEFPLQELSLRDFRAITDTGVSALSAIGPTLRTLDLTNTKITDNALLSLDTLGSLEVFRVSRTLASNAGCICLKGWIALLFACGQKKGRRKQLIGRQARKIEKR